MNQIIYGDENVIAELTYGGRSDKLINELRHHLDFSNPMLTEQGKLYAQEASRVFEQVSGWDVVRATRKAAAAVTGYVQTNTITVVDTVEGLQTMNVRQQRFLMSDEELRKQYGDGRIDGYSETYVDIQPGIIGLAHYDWRCANSGLVHVTETEESLSYKVTHVKEELQSWDEALSPTARLDNARTIQVAKHYMRTLKEDITNRFGGKL